MNSTKSLTGFADLWTAFRTWIRTKWIGSIYFVFFFLDFLLSNLHYLRYGVKSDLPRYYLSGGDVEYWIWDFTWYIRVAMLLLLSVILGWTGYRATKKELACSIIYMVIAVKDCYDYLINHNVGTSLADYSILFLSLTIVHFYFFKKRNNKVYEWKG